VTLTERIHKRSTAMSANRPLYVPVILGTVRKGRMSLHAARLVSEELGNRAGVETELIDIAKLCLATNDAGEAVKDPNFSARLKKADALVIVSPEYNHGYSGLLKHVLDSCLEEYIHKAVGIVGVSAGPFGGTRVIENMLPVMRELGLVTIFWDVNFSNVHKSFAEDGKLLDRLFIGRIDKFLKELIWMAKTLRHGREQISLD
jgi:NAD(P)H-dependent FMN reductase